MNELLSSRENLIGVHCPHCGAPQLFLGAVHVHPAEGGMDVHISLTEGDGHELPTDAPAGVPIVSMNLQCLACEQWALLILASGPDDGTWLKFQDDGPPVRSPECQGS